MAKYISMELSEAIRLRHSVRRYTDQPIEATKVATLKDAVARYNAASGLNIQLVLDEPKAFNGLFISTYGQFSGVRNYLVMAAPKGKEWEEKVGYYGEQLVLLAQTLGLNPAGWGSHTRKCPMRSACGMVKSFIVKSLWATARIRGSSIP